MQRKQFGKGIGRMDAEFINELQNTIDRTTPTDPFNAQAWQGPYLAVIKGHEVIEDDLKWKYELEFITPAATTWENEDDPPVVKTLADGDLLSECWNYLGLGTGEGVYAALNITEIANSSTNVMGIDPSNLPAGFTLQPVPTGAFVWCRVGTTPYTEGGTDVGDAGDLILFEYTNQFDGSC